MTSTDGQTPEEAPQVQRVDARMDAVFDEATGGASASEPEVGPGPEPEPDPDRRREGGADLDRAAEALLSLAQDRPWKDITLKDVADRAGLSFADLYARAPGKAALLWRLSERFDRQAFQAVSAESQSLAKERLFEAFMARLEAMEPHRAALIALARGAGATVVGPRLPLTARGLLEASGIDTSGGRGAIRVAAFTAVWARVLQVWRDDEGALNRTMAEIDRLLTRTERRLARVGAGF